MHVCKSLIKDLLNAEKSLELKQQDIRADTASLDRLRKDIDRSRVTIADLSSRLLSFDIQQKKVRQAFKKDLPGLLPRGISTSNTASLANLDNYPVSSMRVITMPIEYFLEHCRSRGNIGTPNQVSTTINFTRIFRTILRNEDSVADAFSACMSHVLSAMEETPNDEVPPGVSSYTLSLRVAAPRGPLDFAISCFGIVKASQYTSPHLQTRKRWPWANLKVLAFQPLISGEGAGRTLWLRL